MMYLISNIDGLNFAISYSQVTEVVPLVRIIEVPNSPFYLAGMINYRKELIPLIDLQQVMRKRSHKRLMSTRIIITEHNKEGTIAFITENTTDILELSGKEIKERRVNVGNVDYIEKALLIDSETYFVLNINKIKFDLEGLEIPGAEEIEND